MTYEFIILFQIFINKDESEFMSNFVEIYWIV